jgi:hypothetical protein
MKVFNTSTSIFSQKFISTFKGLFNEKINIKVRCAIVCLSLYVTSLNPVPNAQVCVYLTVHITKLQLQITFPKPLYIPHSACIHGTLAAENLDVCNACDPRDSKIQLTMVKDWRLGLGMPFLDIDTCAERGGLFISARVFFPV